ncbi:MAG: TIGR01777 family oxidoreductase [Candidatus Nanopelagicales bacterium]|nr:TIGR01777 family oxidoreductase [Candidatus Nanopelagicales bacterium]MCF8551576.1 TIGR01777 family oxidoreductase [Candidatus Nanopelagicales bacterium]
MKIAVTGASGLIGTPLVAELRSRGHDVFRLVRRAAAAPDEITWNPASGFVDLAALAGTDVVFHLAGAGVGDHRWTDAYKQEIRDSRVMGTDTISRAMAQLDPRPAVLVSASAIGFYGDTGDRAVTEVDPAGHGFLADVVVAWEAAANPAREAGIRVVHPRTGLVVSADGGAWGRMFPLFKAGIGGKLGNGKQYWSWISLRDEISALIFLMENPALSGPVNLTGPTPDTNAEITTIMGKVLRRPTLLPVPRIALTTVLGEFSTEVLSSSRVLPAVLEQQGFVFKDPTVESAIRQALG